MINYDNNIDFIAISNNPKHTSNYDNAGIKYIMIDLEINDKQERQLGRNTLISKHNLTDISKVKESLTSSELIVRINPYHNGSKDEINKVIDFGADWIMLPMAKTAREVIEVSKLIDGKVKLILLAETSSIMFHIEHLARDKYIDRVHIGLNDLSIDTNHKFLFSNMSSSIIKSLFDFLNQINIPCGIGGVGKFDSGIMNSKEIIAMHAVLNSDLVILSRTFFDQFDNESESIKESIAEQINLMREHYIKIRNTNSWEVVRDRFNNCLKLIKENN